MREGILRFLEQVATIKASVTCNACGGSSEFPMIGISDQSILACEGCGRDILFGPKGVPEVKAFLRTNLDQSFDKWREPRLTDAELDHFQRLGVLPIERVMPKQREPGSKTYNVGLVGESFFQRTIERCREGDPVVLFREAGNPYDPRAIVCVTADGDPIGYIARDHFLMRAVHDEKQGCEAEIGSIRGSSGKLGVVILASLCDEPLGERRFVRA